MLPAAFVLLDALPLTPNGKLDRRALPAPEPTRAGAASRSSRRARRSRSCWPASGREVLGMAQVGVHDNFFALGGHSLLATQVIARVREAFQVELPLRSAVRGTDRRRPGRADRSAHAASAGRCRCRRSLPAPRDGALPLSFAQQRLWFLDQLEPGSAAYNIPTAVRLTGALDLAALQRSLDAIVRRHEALRTTFATRRRPAGAGDRAAACALPLPLLDLRALPTPTREARWRSGWRGRGAARRSTWRAARCCARRCCGWPPTSMCCC